MKHLRLLAEPLARTLSVAVLAVMVIALGIGTTQNGKDKNTQPVLTAAVVVKTTTTAGKVKNPTPSATPTMKRASRAASRTAAPKSLALRQVWLKHLLYEAGFRGKGLRTAWAVAMRESKGNPKAHNRNRRTGDNSYGIFQINMLGSMGYQRRAKFDLDSNNELFNPLKNAKIAFYMTKGGKDWSSWGLGKNAYNGNRNEPAYRKWLKHYPSN